MEMETNCSIRVATLEDDLEAFLDEFFSEKVMNGNIGVLSLQLIFVHDLLIEYDISTPNDFVIFIIS
jgi:hypothetical protein